MSNYTDPLESIFSMAPLRDRCKLVRLDQRSRDWYLWRGWGIGGSDIGPIYFGKDWPYDDRGAEKIFRQKTSEPGWETESSFAMRRGAGLEPTARFLTEQRYDIQFYAACCQMIGEADRWKRASLDGIGLHKGQPILLAIKCLDWQKHQLALMGQPPLIYMPQVQWQLHVTGLDECWYCSYSDNLKRFSERDQLALIKIRKNESVFKEQVLPEVEKFWQRIQQWRKENGAS